MALPVASSRVDVTRSIRRGNAEADPDFLEHRSQEPSVPTGSDHSLHAAAPLLHQAKLVKHPSDHPIAKLGNAERQVGDREAKEEESRILNLQPVIEQGDADRGAALGVVGVRHGVDHGFADRRRRQRPAFGPAIGRAHSDVRPTVTAGPGEVVRAGGTRKYLNCHDVGRPVSENFEVRQQAWCDGVADQVGEPLLEGHRIRDSANVPSPVLDTDENGTAGRVRERYDGPQQPLRRRDVALELEGLAFRASERVEEDGIWATNLAWLEPAGRQAEQRQSLGLVEPAQAVPGDLQSDVTLDDPDDTPKQGHPLVPRLGLAHGVLPEPG